MMTVVKNIEFGPVKLTEDFLGIEEGTMFKFDETSGKYVSMGAEEDFSDDGYYYSGFAMAIDPTIIKDNKDLFSPMEVKKPRKKVEKVVEEVKEQEPAMDATPAEEPKEEIPLDIPEGDLSFMCGLCHTNNFIHRIKYGLFFPVAPGTRLQLKCSNCGIETTVYYNMEDELNKESK